jgi:amino acid transporter
MAGPVIKVQTGKVNFLLHITELMRRLPIGFLKLACWLVHSYFPNGVGGVLSGSATLFFAFIGFDTVASTAEEVSLHSSCTEFYLCSPKCH